MSKRNKIIYWIATLWLSLGMASTGIVQVLQLKEETEFVLLLGYPAYFLTIIGVWKLLGVVAVLVPKLPMVKEWAYAGFFFVSSGALISQLAMGHTAIGEWFPAVLLLILTIISWYYRPAGRKPVTF
ncbi:DoxX family protein [Terrimonas rubra]|uniref:DoxX family protein n=1 Tax=Terrimonas rubra TaxID=1035890 RepID=A0ABW6AAG5_9BACT